MKTEKRLFHYNIFPKCTRCGELAHLVVRTANYQEENKIDQIYATHLMQSHHLSAFEVRQGAYISVRKENTCWLAKFLKLWN
jgi:hypothetical protein